MPEEKPEEDTDPLRQIVRQTQEGVLFLDAQGNCIWANRSALRLYGCTTMADFPASRQAHDARYAYCTPDGDRIAQSKRPIDRVVAGETLTAFRAQLLDNQQKDRRTIVEYRSLHLKSNGDLLRVLYLRDVTDEVDAEDRFEAAFASNPAPALILRLADSRFIKVNDGYLQMTGLACDDILHKPLREHDILRHVAYSDAVTAAMRDNAPIAQQESLVPTAQGRSKFVILAGQPIIVFDQPCMLFTFNDLDKRRQAEDSLRTSEAKFATAFQLSPAPMLICEAENWHILDANAGFLAMLDLHNGSVAGKHALAQILGLPQTEIVQLEQALQQADTVQGFRASCTPPGKESRNLQLSAASVQIQDIACVLLILQDVTEQTRSEQELATAIEEVMKDARWFSQSLIEQLARVRRPHTTMSGLDDLTTREREVLDHVCRGRSNDDIARTLGLSRNTVRNHLANIYSKTGARRRSGAVIWGRQRGLGLN